MPKLFVSLICRLTLLAASCWALSACSSRVDAMAQTAKAVFQSSPDASALAAVNPSIRYLRIEINDRVLLLALGYIDAHPLGPVEVWYSSQGEVLRLQNGHVVGLTGPDVEWRQVRLSTMPAWPADSTAASTYTRIRDVMPGYRFGIVDELSIRAINTPSQSNLVTLAAQSLRWYEEHEAKDKLPPARFALSNTHGQDTVVYGEQCISRALCLSWQQWPPTATLR